MKLTKTKKILITLGLVAIIAMIMIQYPPEMGIVPSGQFDTCDTLSNIYGAWGSSYSALSTGTTSPAQGSGYVSSSITNAYHTFIFKDAPGYDFWDVSSNPILSMQIRPSQNVHAEFTVVTGTGSTQWQDATMALPLPLVNEWNTFTVDLRTMTYNDNSQPIDVTQIRRIVVYVQTDYIVQTVDIDNLTLSDSGIITPTPTATPTGEEYTLQIITYGSGTTQPSGTTYYPKGEIVAVNTTSGTFDHSELYTSTGTYLGSSTTNPEYLTMNQNYILHIFFVGSASPTPVDQTPLPTSTPKPVELPVVGPVDQTTLGLMIVAGFTLMGAIIAVVLRKKKAIV